MIGRWAGKGLHLGVGLVMLFVQLAFVGPSGLAAAVSTGPPATVVVTASPSTVPADGVSTATITATVYDVYGQPVPYATVNFSTNLGTLGQPQILGASVHRAVRLAGTLVTAGTSAGPVDLRSAVLAGPAPSPAVAVVPGSSGSTAGPFWTDQNGQAQDTISSTQTGTATITVTADNGVVGTVQVNFASPTGGKVELVASPTSIPPNGTTTSTLTATVYGPNGQPVPGTQVTFQTTLGQLDCYSCVRTTDPAGQASVQLTSEESGQAVITVAAANFSPGVAQVVVTSVQLHLYATTDSIPADGVTSSTVSAVVYDSSGQPMPGVEVNFSVANSPDIRAFFNNCFSCINEGYAATTNSHGVAPITVSGIANSSQEAGTATISAGAVGVQEEVSLSFTKPSGGQVDVSASPQNIVPQPNGNGVSVTASAYNAQNQAVSGLGLNFVADSGGLASDHEATNAQGQAQDNLAVWNSWYGPVPAGPDTITVMAANLLPGTAVVNVDYSGLYLVAPLLTAGMTTSIAVYASNYVDQWGTPTNQPLSGVPIALSASGGSVTPSTGSTNSEGVLTAQLSADNPGLVTLTAIATGNFTGSVAPAQTTVSFDATATSVGVSVAPSEVPADGHTVAVITATVEDAAGAPVAEAPVRFTSNLGVLGQQGVLSTNLDGQVTDTVYSLTAGTAQVTATSGGVSKAAQVVFYSTAPSQVQVWAWPERAPADGKSISTVTALVLNGGDQPIPGVSVSFSTDLGMLLPPISGVTNAHGEITEEVYSATVGTATVTAVAAGASGTTTVTFYSTAPSKVQVGISIGQVPADGKTTSTVTAQVLNGGGQPIPGVSVSFSTDLGMLLPPISGVTNAQGEVTDAVYSVTPGTATVTVVAAGILGTATVVFYSTVPFQVQVRALPGDVPANGKNPSMVTAWVTDAAGYGLAGVPVTFSTDLGSLGQPLTVPTDSWGEASDTITSTTAGTATVTAAGGQHSARAQVTFYSTMPAKIQVWPPSAQVPVNGQTRIAVTAWVTDAAGYGLSGVPVTFSTDFGLLGQPLTVPTDSAGEASDTITSAMVGTATVTATTYGGASGTATVHFFNPGVPSQVELSASPGLVPADGHSTAELMATVVNAGGQAVSGVPVSFSTDLGTLADLQGVTDAQGQVSTLVYSRAAGMATVTVSVYGGLSGTTTVDFYSVVPTAVQVRTSADLVPADGKTAVTVTAHVTDMAGYGVAGVPVTFSSTLGVLVNPTTVQTNSSGDASETVTSGTAGTATVTATVGRLSSSAQVTFYSMSKVVQVQVAAAPESVPADGKTTAALTATVLNAGGQPVVGVPVSFSADLGTVVSAGAVSDDQGQVSAVVYSAQAGTAMVTATADGISGTAAVEFYTLGVAGVHVQMAPQSVPADGKTAATVTATVLDGGGLPMDGVSVTFSTNLGNLGILTGITNQQGMVFDTVYSSTVGTATVTATTSNGESGSATVTFWTGGKYLLFTSDPGTAATSVWGKTLPADDCAGSGCGSTAGQGLPWTFTQATFLVNQPSAAGDVYIVGSADASYAIRVSYTNPGYGPTNTLGSFSGGVTTINMDNLPIPFNEGGGQGRTVTLSLFAPAGATSYGVGNIYLYATGGDQIYHLNTSAAPALALGGAIGTVGGTVSLPLSVAAAPLPFNSVTVGNGKDLSFNSAELQFDGATGASAATMQSVSVLTSSQVSFALSAPAGLTAGQQAATFNFTCLSAGTATVTINGGQFTTSQEWWMGGNLPSATAQVTCTAPDTPIGISGFTPGSVPQTTPGTGVPVQMNITGWGLNAAKTVTLVSQNGGADVQGTIVSSAVYGGSLQASFGSVPLGAYQVEVQEAGGANTATGTGDFVVAPGIPMFTVTQQAFWSMAPGVPYQHTWTVSNQGLVPGVALVLIDFPAGVQATPCSGTDVVYSANGVALVAVSEAPGAASTFCYAETLLPGQVQYPGSNPTPGSANVQLGTFLHTADLAIANLTMSQWSSMAGLPFTQMVQAAPTAMLHLDEQYWTAIDAMSAAGQAAYLNALGQANPAFAPPTSLTLPNGIDPPGGGAWAYLGNALTTLGSSFWNSMADGAVADSLAGFLNGATNELVGVSVFSSPPFANDMSAQVFGAGETDGELTMELEKGICDFADCLGDSTSLISHALDVIKNLEKILGDDPGAQNYITQLVESGKLVVASEDPNSIAAFPPGAGTGSYILNGQNLYVQVHFENSPKANAAAQNVRVDVQLGPNLDPNSVHLLSASTSSLPVMSVSPSGLVRFYFDNIDLPRDINPPAGEGMVEFQVSPLANLADNAPLTVSANVYFDYNPPVATQALNYQIDAVNPTATVAPLPAESPASFPVSWSGSDPGGPGIAAYTVFVSTNGGAYQPWQQDTTQTTAVYDGQAGDSYSFIAQAQDLLGQTQPMPSQAQASTTVAASSGSAAGGGGGGGGAPTANTTAGTGMGPNGGTVTAGNGALTLDVPPGAFANQTGIAAQPLSTAQAYAPPGRAFAGASLQWSISAGGVQPTKPVLATFRYDQSALNGLNPLRLGIYGYDPNTAAWQWVGGRVYGSQGTVSAELNRFGTYAVFADTNSFSDLSQAPWARNAVDTLLGADLIAGMSPGVFDPNGNLTRAQFTTLLVKADGLAPVASGATPFTDVAATAWYAPYVAAAYHAGLVAGVSPTSFDPNGDLTREQLAVMLAKLLGSGVPSGNLGRFTDASSIAPWARSGVAVAGGAGLMSGYPGGAFRPTGISSRAQAAAVLAQYLAYVGKV